MTHLEEEQHVERGQADVSTVRKSTAGSRLDPTAPLPTMGRSAGSSLARTVAAVPPAARSGAGPDGRMGVMDDTQRERIRSGHGFFAALDQSGSSTPKALADYGIAENRYGSEKEMFDLVLKQARIRAEGCGLRRKRADDLSLRFHAASCRLRRVAAAWTVSALM
jgi:hypothetical protein